MRKEGRRNLVFRRRGCERERERARRAKKKKKKKKTFFSPFRVHEGVRRVRPVPVGYRRVRRGHRLPVLPLPEALWRAVLSQRESLREERGLLLCRRGGVEGVEDALAAFLDCLLFVLWRARERGREGGEGSGKGLSLEVRERGGRKKIKI